MSPFDHFIDWYCYDQYEYSDQFYAFGEAISFLASEPETQISLLEGSCPFLLAWYEYCCLIVTFNERLNNRMLGGFFDSHMSHLLKQLITVFEALDEDECEEGVEGIYYMQRWCEIRGLSKQLLNAIEWSRIVEFKESYSSSSI